LPPAFGPDDIPKEAAGDLAKQNYNNLKEDRDKILEKACKALQSIEMIMGEYSGLGLCDIIAVMGALYIMPKSDLLGFLDPDSTVRMKGLLKVSDLEFSFLNSGRGELGNDQPTESNLAKSLTSFIDNVNDFYNLMNKIFKDKVTVSNS